ncbi:hypothetical protein C8R44DRAFT_769942 [Mycena epipterygia]|nr:hypothetical protein C8R44DRAFT_769942 [Mycena epipterygia]
MFQNTKIETILVASDWKSGLAKSQIPHQPAEEVHKTGFIGRGSSKNVIYARVGNEEYALGQSQDELLSPTEHERMLNDEMRNMCIGESIRKEFFTVAVENEVTVVDFQFNVEGAILGLLEPLEEGHISASLGLPFQHFIATRYLPCGPSDKPIQKFTGNTDCGNPPNDPLTMAIHSFTHFVILYTGEYLALCPSAPSHQRRVLSGMFNRKGMMMLVDPQSHTSEPDSSERMYWDNGPKAIQHFLEHHLEVCDKNYICNKMAMKTMEFLFDNPLDTQETDDIDIDIDAAGRLLRSRISHSPQRSHKKAKVHSRPQSPIPAPRGAPIRHGWPSPQRSGSP